MLIAVRAGKCREWSTPASLPDDPGAVYQGSVPIPMSLPGEAYGRAGTKKPWFFMGSN